MKFLEKKLEFRICSACLKINDYNGLAMKKDWIEEGCGEVDEKLDLKITDLIDNLKQDG
jgi:hypothetical protein